MKKFNFSNPFIRFSDWFESLSLHKKAYAILGIVSSLILLCMVAVCIPLHYLLGSLPSTDSLENYTPSLTTYVYDINDTMVSEFSVEKRAYLNLDRIPENLQHALVAMEDQQFYNHPGISVRGIFRSVVSNVMRGRKAQGGSTITQQLSRGIFLTAEKTIIRKIKEILLAFHIERKFSKQEILTLYLNQIYLGGGVYGVQSAAKHYFGKNVDELSLAECAMLVGLIPSPERYSPFKNPDSAKQRRKIVLDQMVSFSQRKKDKDDKTPNYSAITKEAADLAAEEPFATEPDAKGNSHGAYFVEHVRQQLKTLGFSDDQIYKGGYKVYTTLDINMQKVAEEVMEKYLSKYDEAVAQMPKPAPEKIIDENGVEQEAPAPSTAPVQGAFIILDNKTGGIRCLVGGRNFKDSKFNRALQARRQPGSTFKPFVWMAALMNGYTPASIVDDSPMAYYFDGRDWRLLEGATDQYSIDLAVAPFVGNPEFKIWVPNNFDGKSRGPITARRALEASRNLASIYLVTRVGPTSVVDVAHQAGIDPKRFLNPVPSIGLGTSLVTPMEMTTAFSTFANGGIHVEPFAIAKVVDSQGRVVYENYPEETESFSPQLSYVLVNMMKGVVQRGTGVRASVLKRPLAGKTGTSQDSKDMWFIGMTPDLTAGAWMGYDDQIMMSKQDWTGGSTVLPWWTEIMSSVFKDMPVRDFTVPDGITFVTIDQDSGKLALPTCKKKLLEAFVAGTEPHEFCDVEH
ncbi:MAG: transglycosylase domain-containing protein [Elusimicrobiales bacterium]|nr:transglycosylase domain-containing protein [Elusimicrobiales bacterium]